MLTATEKDVQGRVLVFLEMLYAIVVLLCYTRVFWWALPKNIQSAMWYPIYAIAGYLVFRERKKAAQIIQHGNLLVLLLFFVLASSLWSIDPGFTLRRSLALVGSTLFGLYLSIRYGYRQQINFFLWAFGIATVLNILSPWLCPDNMFHIDTAMHFHYDKFRGAFDNRNLLGATMALGAITFIFAPSEHKIWTVVKSFFAAMALALLLKSNSKTSLIVFVGALGLLGTHLCLRKFKIFNIFLFALFLSLWPFFFMWGHNNSDKWLETIGRDRTFTNRTLIWEETARIADMRPLVGYGYCALWDSKNRLLVSAQRAIGESFTSPHSGFLKVRTDLGWTGLCIFLLLFLQTAQRAYIFSARPKSMLPLVFLIALFMLNGGESFFIKLDYITWPMFISIYFLGVDVSP